MNLKIISAGAGSGKTYRLTEELVNLLGKGMSASGIIATTFTKKAAAELQERVRVSLLKQGYTQQADELTNALIGTVHSLGVKLLRRFAFEAGVSPEVSIIAEEDEHFMFNQSLATVLTSDRVEAMDALASKLGLNKRDFFDWRKEVHQITSLARANDFSIEVLDKSRERSFETYRQFLGPVSDHNPEWFNDELTRLLSETIEKLENNADTTKKTAQVVDFLKLTKRELELRGFLFWYQWAKISKVSPGAKSREDMEALHDFARQHDTHPEFHRDIKDYIDLLYTISIEAINEYNTYKNKRGLIDYTDMEASVNQLLDNPLVQEVLKEELSLLMVDEFQDTSPIQLSIFLKLARLADQSIWVGDPKQSIYGFRGAEPRLMQAIIEQSGGVKPGDIQKYSWRSREDAVFASNAIFTKAFSEMPADQVALIPKRTLRATADSINDEDESSAMGKALVHWHFKAEGEGRQPAKPWMENCIARTIRETLDLGIFIQPKGEKEVRRAVAGDVAVLCRSNAGCQVVAGALADSGLKVAIARSGLLNTAEAKLILACLKYLLNPKDSLAVAEILLLGDGIPVEDIVEDRMNWLERRQSETHYEQWASSYQQIQKLDELRPETAELSSAEILDYVLEVLDLRRMITSWSNNRQRLENVETLRKFALDYEDACNRMHSAASLGGFYLWLDDLERNQRDMQSSGTGSDSVNVLTYHKSKGLEWPIVICHNLDDKLRSDVWGLEIVPETDEVDLSDVLGNRWLRFWVNPYGDQYRKTELETRINESEAKKEKLKRSLSEEARLLYVAITRARDYIVFPTNAYPTKWLNRVWHNGREDFPVLDPQSKETMWEWNNRFLEIDTTIFEMPRSFEAEASGLGAYEPAYFSRSIGTDVIPPFRVDPSELSPNVTIDNVWHYHSPLLIEDFGANTQPGIVLSAFFAAYVNKKDKGKASVIGDRLAANFELEEHLEKMDLQDRVDAFWQMLMEHFDITEVRTNYPLGQYFEGRLLDTELDFKIRTVDGIVIIRNDFTSGQESQLKKRAIALGNEMSLCKEAVSVEEETPNVRTLVHFILDGVLIEIFS